MEQTSTKGKTNWTAIAAIGTLLAVLWAIYHQEIRTIINCPVLEFSLFEQTKPHLAEQVGASYEKIGFKEYDGLFITVQITNTGKTIAKDAQPLLTAIGYRDKEGIWQCEHNWIPIPLQWVLGEGKLERDLIPERPYLFNIASVSNARDGRLLFTYATSPKSQKETIGPGEHCFEVTVFAVGAKSKKKYFYVNFDEFKWKMGRDEIKKRIEVEMRDNPPW